MRFSRLFAAAAFLVPILPATADDSDTIAAWYAALLTVDRDRLADLLSGGATIRLEDLGVEQSRAEFMASLDEWETAAEGADIRHRLEGDENGMVAVTVCYDFPDNDLLTHELFRIDAGKVLESVQSTVSEDCGDL